MLLLKEWLLYLAAFTWSGLTHLHYKFYLPGFRRCLRRTNWTIDEARRLKYERWGRQRERQRQYSHLRALKRRGKPDGCQCSGDYYDECPLCRGQIVVCNCHP